MSAIVTDNYFASGLVRAAAATWPSREWGHWLQYANGKLCSKSPYQLPQAVNLLLSQMAEISLDRLFPSAIAPAPELFPDLEFLHGAGMHQQDAGTSLGLHLDTERHPSRPWRREATAILYLDSCEGGELDMTDANGKVQQRIEPVQNRLVVFSTPAQYHRVNECKSLRRSICLFFWSICDDGFVGGTRANFI